MNNSDLPINSKPHLIQPFFNDKINYSDKNNHKVFYPQTTESIQSGINEQEDEYLKLSINHFDKAYQNKRNVYTIVGCLMLFEIIIMLINVKLYSNNFEVLCKYFYTKTVHLIIAYFFVALLCLHGIICCYLKSKCGILFYIVFSIGAFIYKITIIIQIIILIPDQTMPASSCDLAEIWGINDFLLCTIFMLELLLQMLLKYLGWKLYIVISLIKGTKCRIKKLNENSKEGSRANSI